MKLGLAMFVTAYSIDVISLARTAEACGFDSLWLPEHPVIPVHTTDGYQTHGLKPLAKTGERDG